MANSTEPLLKIKCCLYGTSWDFLNDYSVFTEQLSTGESGEGKKASRDVIKKKGKQAAEFESVQTSDSDPICCKASRRSISKREGLRDSPWSISHQGGGGVTGRPIGGVQMTAADRLRFADVIYKVSLSEPSSYSAAAAMVSSSTSNNIF